MDHYRKAGLYPEAMAAFRLMTDALPEWSTVSKKDRESMWLVFLSGWIARESFGKNLS